MEAPPTLGVRTLTVTRRRRQVRFRLDCDGGHVGHIELMLAKLNGKPVWNVLDIQVAGHLRRRGYGTALYRAAYAFTSGRNETLASLCRGRDSHSNSFWAKAEREGKATRYPAAGWSHQDAFVLTSDLL